eukprot:2898952-Rhodomonas_salina.1
MVRPFRGSDSVFRTAQGKHLAKTSKIEYSPARETLELSSSTVTSLPKLRASWRFSSDALGLTITSLGRSSHKKRNRPWSVAKTLQQLRFAKWQARVLSTTE